MSTTMATQNGPTARRGNQVNWFGHLELDKFGLLTQYASCGGVVDIDTSQICPYDLD